MKKPVLCIIAPVLAILMTGCLSETRQRETARVEGNRFIVTFDLRWDMEERYSVANLYDIDSATVDAVYGNKSEFISDSASWKIDREGKNMVLVSKMIETDAYPFIRENDILLIDDGWVRRDEVAEKPPVNFGINRINNAYAIEFHKDDTLATFRLKGYGDAENVNLAGSFNGWNTMNTPMRKAIITENNVNEVYWVVSIRMDPGKYTYKYIVDGKWIPDPSNMIRERENGRGLVSVAFFPSALFRLDGYPDARRVVLTGNFLNWSRRGVRMTKAEDHWELPVYLGNGTWSYKFIADGEWIPDPVNMDTRPDASGNINSFISIGEKHHFRLKGFNSSEKVVLTGSFNNWNENELVMIRDSAGWFLDYVTGPGNWEYKFIADGEWMTDPDNPYTTGSGDYINSFLPVKPNHTFILSGHASAQEVVVTGTFTNWSNDDYKMIRKGDNWILPLHLQKGKTLYKFIVDGEWLTDPGNEIWEENQYGTGNSVLWID